MNYHEDEELYYPLNDKPNQKIYQKYFKISQKENNVYFGRRPTEYKYYDQHQVIESALDFVNQFK